MDRLWQDTHNHARDINYGKWNEDLDRVWMELEDDAKKEQKDEMKKINATIYKLSLYGISSKLKKNNPALYSKLVLIQKEALIRKEILLRSLQNKAGKGTAYEESVEDYMDDGF
jgi:hypothetical protein